MKTLYFECHMGAAGDMLMGALLELHPQPEEFMRRLNSLHIPHVAVSAQAVARCGINGTHVSVLVDGVEEQSVDVGHMHEGHEHDTAHHHAHAEDDPDSLHAAHEHCHDEHNDHIHVHAEDTHGHHHGHGHNDTLAAPHPGAQAHSVDAHAHDHPHEHDHDHSHDHAHTHHHASLHDIEHILGALDLPDAVRADALAVYRLIAEAESHAHGRPVEEIHFHEVGTMDAVTDIVGVCLLLHELAPDRILSSPVRVGGGQIRCAHGILPVPAPATAYLLRGIPFAGGPIEAELCTPTGAALLRHFVSEFIPMPVMRLEKIGYGMGSKEFSAANCVRALLGETAEGGDEIVELHCNIDDMTAEELGFAQEQLLAGGALDVFTTAIGMKKNRPGTLLTCICHMEQRESLIRLLFQHTATLGIRQTLCQRYTLTRRETETETPFGTVRIKESEGWGVKRDKIEYEDLCRIAREKGLSILETRRQIEQS